MSPVAVGEGMNQSQPMMETNGALVERVTPVSKLRLDVLAEIVELRRDLISEYADVLLGEAERSRPFPNLVEHLLMQQFEPCNREQIVSKPPVSRGKSPASTADDIVLLAGVELGLKADIRNEAVDLI